MYSHKERAGAVAVKKKHIIIVARWFIILFIYLFIFYILFPVAPVGFKETLDGWPPPVSSAG